MDRERERDERAKVLRSPKVEARTFATLPLGGEKMVVSDGIFGMVLVFP